MKKIIYILSVCFMVVAWTGCDELLDVTPQTDFSDVDFWKSENDLKGATMRLYQQLPFLTQDQRADEWVSRNANSISMGSRPIPTTSGDWTDNYQRIFATNNILEKAVNAPIDEQIINKYLAQARFFRAWYYFDLVSKYGDVPLVLKTFKSTADPDLKMGRAPRADVIQQIYDDLEFAAEWLPTRADMESVVDEFERRFVTRSSALGLMVRVGLREGTMLKFHGMGSDSEWRSHLQKSIDAFNLLKAEGHELYTEGGPSVAYQAMFLDESNSTNKEIIFAKAYGPNETTGSSAVLHNFTAGTAMGVQLSRTMIDTYLYADGLPREKSSLVVANETSFNHVFGYESDGVTRLAGGIGERDPRLELSIWRVFDPQDTEEATVAGKRIGFLLCGTGPYRPDMARRNASVGYTAKKIFVGSLYNKDDTDLIHIRWGEMLIAYAEALYELNGSITDAQLDETVNALRARVGFDARLTNAFVNANGLDMREEIRRERQVELMGENHRYDDLIRWKTAETVLPKAWLGCKFIASETNDGEQLAVDPTFTSRLTDEEGKLDGVQEYGYPELHIYVYQRSTERRFDPAKDYFYPIPTYEIGQSDGNIEQNPGWR
ncbi:MAG: RagB/SusD family nutrient uptake outer membrane protein [Bacteroidales bacterium]|nr:RagB/SusD family nutrient uptake outer membrane protein [Bacteroidales bacterium]